MNYSILKDQKQQVNLIAAFSLEDFVNIEKENFSIACRTFKRLQYIENLSHTIPDTNTCEMLKKN